jgi:Uncharacterized protein conserved in bacteria (DUF2252)
MAKLTRHPSTIAAANLQPQLSPITPAGRRTHGKRLRDAVPRDAHVTWRAHAGRDDPISIFRSADPTRQPELVPLRYGRMLQSPFTFYRGSAGVMAADLALTPATGIRPGVRRRPSAEFRRLRDTGAPADLRYQRPRRDAPRAMGVGSQAAGRFLRSGRPLQCTL